jgi:hypothetical protein
MRICMYTFTYVSCGCCGSALITIMRGFVDLIADIFAIRAQRGFLIPRAGASSTQHEIVSRLLAIDRLLIDLIDIQCPLCTDGGNENIFNECEHS